MSLYPFRAGRCANNWFNWLENCRGQHLSPWSLLGHKHFDVSRPSSTWKYITCKCAKSSHTHSTKQKITTELVEENEDCWGVWVGSGRRVDSSCCKAESESTLKTVSGGTALKPGQDLEKLRNVSNWWSIRMNTVSPLTNSSNLKLNLLL